MNLFSAFAATVARRRYHPAIFWGEAQLAYDWLVQRAGGLARTLREGCGGQRGDRVAVWLKNCPEFPAALFGVWRAGGVVVLVNNFLKPEEVDYILRDSGAQVVITDHSLAEHQAKLAALHPGLKFLHVEEFAPLAETESPAAAELTESDLAALLYTSGTTGRPKGAMLTHGNFLANVASCITCLDFHEEDRLLVLLPQFHSFMFTVGTLCPLLKGASIVLVKSVSPFKHVLDDIHHRRATMLPAVPPIHRALAGLPAGVELPSLRLCISGGAPLPLEVLKQFHTRFPKLPLIEGYGPTESSPVATVNPIFGTPKAGSVGLPIPGVELSIRDDNGNELPAGATGELCIRGPNVMQGYWNQPEETALVLRDAWLYTGDLGHRDADGFYFITDRKKDMLLVNGINVYPREVEEVIHKFPGVKDTAVIGVPDARRGEQPLAFVVLADGAVLDEKALHNFVREKLADYKVPRHFRVLPALPRNATGKVLKTTLRDMAKSAPATG
ncbi:MAG: long-chain fatty acid--CoA ligase [Proteobacteria bacterium]|nr:long-chain fatty acid--CoA ligase [Pseudomonadota bacterium]